MNLTHFKAVVKSKLGKPFSDDLEIFEETRDGEQVLCCQLETKLQVFDLIIPPAKYGLAVRLPVHYSDTGIAILAGIAGRTLRRHLLEKTREYLRANISDNYNEQIKEEKGLYASINSVTQAG